MELGAGCDTGPESWGPAGLACPLTSGSSLPPSIQAMVGEGGGELSVLGAWSPVQLPAGDPLCKCHQVCALDSTFTSTSCAGILSPGPYPRLGVLRAGGDRQAWGALRVVDAGTRRECGP